MASKSMMSKAITKAVDEASRVALQTMVEAQAQRTQNAGGPKLCGSKQFIHGLNNKCMLEGILKELTITKDDD